MKTYELTYIISSQSNQDEATQITKTVESWVQDKEGIVIKSHTSSPQTLSYLIKKTSSGFFASLQFQADQQKIKEIKTEIDKNGSILRSIIVVKKPLKIMKERRTRKPLEGFDKKASDSVVFKKEQKETRVQMEDIDKKLDEI